MEQKYIVKNQLSNPLHEEITQQLLLIESKLMWKTVFCIKLGDLTRARMWANEVLYIRHIKASFSVK